MIFGGNNSPFRYQLNIVIETAKAITFDSATAEAGKQIHNHFSVRFCCGKSFIKTVKIPEFQ